MNKVISIETALSLITDRSTLMVSGFMANGAPETLMTALALSDKKDFTLIATDTGTPTTGCGKLIVAKKVKKLFASHIGLNPETGKQMNEGLIDVILTPQGTLAEQIRCAGAGLGGFLTPTGVGTVVAEGKKVLEYESKEYLLEHPLKADIALIRGSIVDERGNIFYKGTTQNFNPLMAMAADLVIVEAQEIVPVGTLLPEHIMTPFNFVDYIVKEHTHG